MAQDRLFHKRLGHSEKLAQLSDFEFIVWTCYVLSADDYGVMRRSAVTLQADHDRLLDKGQGVIERALARSVDVGLIDHFDHQGRAYIYQWDWQDFQKVRYPGRSHNPIPPLEKCSELTRKLFGARTEELSLKGENVSEVVQQKSSRAPVLPHGNGDANVNAHAYGNGNVRPIPDAPSPEVADRAAGLLDTFSALYSKHRHGAKFLRLGGSLQWTEACTLCGTWDDATLSKLIEILLTTDDEWVTRTDRGWKIFVARAQWCAERLAGWEASQKARRPA